MKTTKTLTVPVARGLQRVLLRALTFVLLAVLSASCKKTILRDDTGTTANRPQVKMDGVECNTFDWGEWVYGDIPDGVDANGNPKYKKGFTWQTVSHYICYETQNGPTGGAPPAPYVLPAEGDPLSTVLNVSGTSVSDINTYLQCFDPDADATVTIYVLQPSPGSSLPWISSPYYIGESFVQIRQGSVARVFGYYPSGGIQPGVTSTGTGVFLDKSGASYHVSLTFGVPAANFAAVLALVKNYMTLYPSYNFNTNSNVDFSIHVGNLSGQSILVSDEYFSPGGWAKPAAYLGQMLRNQQFALTCILNDAGGAADSSMGCP